MRNDHCRAIKLAPTHSHYGIRYFTTYITLPGQLR